MLSPKSIIDSIYELYVVQDSGVCLFHATISGKSEYDETIVSSFLSAIETFSNNIRSNVNKLSLKDCDFIYHREGPLIYVVRARIGVDHTAIVNTLRSVSQEFKKHFLKDQPLDGDVRVFKVIGKLFLSHLRANRYIIHPGSQFEISGKRISGLSPAESKVFSILRLKGRLDIVSIAKLLRLGEEETINVTKRLLQKDVITVAPSFFHTSDSSFSHTLAHGVGH